MRKRVCLPFLLCLQALPSISSRQKRQLNFESDSTENDQRPTSKVFFGLTNIFGSGFGGIVGSNGNGDTCSCSTGSDPGDRLPAPRVGQLCNCATSVEFGGDCKGRDSGDRFFWLRMRWAWEWDLHVFKEEKEANCRLWECERRNTRENFQSEVCDSFCDRKKCKLIWP